MWYTEKLKSFVRLLISKSYYDKKPSHVQATVLTERVIVAFQQFNPVFEKAKYRLSVRK